MTVLCDSAHQHHSY